MKRTLLAIFILITTTSFGQDIFSLIDKKDYIKLEEYLKAGFSADQHNSKGFTALREAVRVNDTVLVKMLINYKADVNFLPKDRIHPIMVGCLTNAYESVKILLDNGVDVNWKSSAVRNQQPIRFASQGGSLKLVKLLLSRGANMEASPDDGATPLMAAIHAKKFDIAEFYFNNGAKTGVVGRDGETIIHEAILSGNPEMVRLAIKYEAPLNIKTPNGKTTMQLAKQSGNSEIKSLVKSATEGGE